MRVHSLDWDDPLEKGMATHSTILAWRIPWTEQPGGVQSWDHKELDTTEHTCAIISIDEGFFCCSLIIFLNEGQFIFFAFLSNWY